MKKSAVLFLVFVFASLYGFSQFSWPAMIRVYYKNASNATLDNIVIRFSADSTVTLEESTEWDARSLNCCTFIASLKGEVNFAIQTRPLAFDRDTVRLRVESTTAGNFKLSFADYANFTEAREIILLDQFTGTQQEVKSNPLYDFSITGDTASQGAHRFKLAFVAEQLALRCPQNITVNNDPGLNGANVQYSVSALARCGTPSIQYSVPPGGFFPLGQTTVQATATDSCGNTSTCSFMLTVTDAEAPSILAPQALSFSTDPGTDQYRFTPAPPTATDNSGIFNIAGSRSDGDQLTDPYPLGNTLITWTASDAAGNSSAATQLITVNDTEPPAILASNASLSTDAQQCYSSGAPVPATATDNVQLESLAGVRSDGLAMDAPYPKGNTVITWTAVDIYGNTSTAQQQVAVMDNESPLISPVSVPPATANHTGCTYIVEGTALDPGYGDNCGPVTLRNSFNNTASLAGAALPVGATNITWTATDAAGNNTTWLQVVQVTAPPVNLSIPDANVLPQGVKPNTVYPGYAPAEVLTFTATTSSQGLAYSWTVSAGLQLNGAGNMASVQLSATTSAQPAEQATLTATNSIGCTVILVKPVNVVNVSCGARNDKVLLCNGSRQSCVMSSGVNGYLLKGYTLGACETTAGRFTTEPAAVAAAWLKVYPNPGTGLFRLQLGTIEEANISLKVTDIMGKVILSKQIDQPAALQQLDLQPYPAGVYILHVTVAQQVRTMKIIKR